MHTSTVYATQVYTVTQCAVHVVNCPAEYQQEIVITSSVEIYTTVCPIDEVQTLPPVPSAPASLKPHTITGGATLTPCPTPIVNTFVPPADAEIPEVKTKTFTVILPKETSPVPQDSNPDAIFSANATAGSQSSSVVISVPEVTAGAPKRCMAVITGMAMVFGAGFWVL